MAVRAPRSLVRPLVQRLHAYVPGEQPKIPGLIKLNTNENPYPPSPKVLAAVKAAVDGRLRLYPNPTASALREGLAKQGMEAEPSDPKSLGQRMRDDRAKWARVIKEFNVKAED